jgi:hypothetical protein
MIINNLKKYLIIVLCVIVGYSVSNLVIDFVEKKNEKFFYYSTVAINNPLNIDENLVLKNITLNRLYFDTNNFPLLVSEKNLNFFIKNFIVTRSNFESHIRGDLFNYTDSMVMDSKITYNDNRVCIGKILDLNKSILTNELTYNIKTKFHSLDESLNKKCIEFIQNNLENKIDNYRKHLKNSISKEIKIIEKKLEEVKDKKNIEILTSPQPMGIDFIIKYYVQNINFYNFLVNEYSKPVKSNFKVIKTEKKIIDPLLRYSAINYMGIYFGFLIGLIIVYYRKIINYLTIVWKK